MRIKRSVFMTSDIRFLLTPGDESAPVYSWVWNDRLTREGIARRLDDMARIGVKTFYIIPESKQFRPVNMPTYLEPDYLTDAYLCLFAFAAEEAEKRGMTLWLYDEDGWPSGSAGGHVGAAKPQLCGRKLEARARTLAAGETYVPAEDALAAFAADGERLRPPFRAERENQIDEYCSVPCGGERKYPELLLRETTDEFIAQTHEKYAPFVGARFGGTIGAVFTDEPSVNMKTGEPRVYARFHEKFGYDMLDFLPTLVSGKTKNARERRALMDFYGFCAEEFAENYFTPLRAWSNAHGMPFTGHVDQDDASGFIGKSGNLLAALRCMDIPGVDCIYRQIFPENPMALPGANAGLLHGWNSFFPRFASSAAHQTGARRVLSETFAVYGASTSFDQMRYTVNFQALRGVNLFNFMCAPYGKGGHVTGAMRPCFTAESPRYDALRTFNRYTAKISHLAALGEEEIPQALYMPLRDWWAEPARAAEASASFFALGREIEKRCGAFDVIDDEWILRGEAEKYQTVFIADAQEMPEAVRARLEAYIARGGRAVITGCAEVDGAIRVQAEEIGEYVAAPVRAEEAQGALRVSARTLPGGRRLLLFNEGAEKTTARVAFDEPVAEIGLLDDTLTRCEGECALSFEMGEMRAFVTGAWEEAEEPEREAERSIRLESFEWKPVRRFLAGGGERRLIELDEPFREGPLEPWANALGSGFSGTVLYRARFTLPQAALGRGAVLRLAKLENCCFVRLNGVTLPDAMIFSPFQMKLPARLLRGKNELELLVSNTCANEFVRVDAVLRETCGTQGPYHEMTLLFERNETGGGIAGAEICW